MTALVNPTRPGGTPTAALPGRAARVLLALYLVVLAGAAFLPLPSGVTPRGSGVAYELTLHRPDLLGGWEARRNVLMTIPFGVLLPLVVRWRYEALVAACVGVTLVIETVQLLVSAAVGWPWRAFDVNDLLLNTVGGLLGLAVTGAALVAVRRPAWPRARRLVPGALAALLVGWAVAATATPDTPATAHACDEAPAGAVTALPGGAEAYAGSDGSVCLRAGGVASAVPRDAPAGPVLSVDGPDGTWEVGTAQPGDVRTTGAGGAVVELHPVEGADVLVWAVPR